MSTYRPIVITSYDPEIHTSVSKTVFTGIKIATDDVDDQVTWQADGHTITIDFDTDITALNVTIEYELI